MSGTSCDGLDVVYCEIENNYDEITVNPIFFEAYQYDEDLRSHLLHLTSGKINVAEVSHANFYLAERFSDFILDFIEKYELKDKVDLIVSHGQTIYHDPYGDGKKNVPCTLQIGDGDIISVRTGVKVLSDLRIKDMAVGGQGAPLVVYSDFVIFNENNKSVALQNIGGIGNVTFIPENNDINCVKAFDTGPGNVLIDMSAKELFSQNFDLEGSLSAKGKKNEKFFNSLISLEEDYFEMIPPKSTGKEMRYNGEYFQEILKLGEKFEVERHDFLRTVVDFTAWTIYKSYEKYLGNIDILYITGGGALNKTLVSEIKENIVGAEVRLLDTKWTEAKEAIAFAVMGNEYLNNHFCNVKSSTGASKSVTLGKLSIPD